MSKQITITPNDILQQVKLSCQIPEIIEGIITRKVIAEAVTEMGIEVELEELQRTADTMRLIHKINTSKETWHWLEKHHLSLDEFEEIAYNTVISGKLVTHLFADKVEPYFFENQLNYTGVVMYEVVLDDEDLAMELYYAILEGEMSFHEVAHQYIQDKDLRRKGGYKGIMGRKSLKPEISAAVFAAQPSQVLKPIVTSQGVHLIFVEEIIEPKLSDKIRYQIMSDLFDAWLKQRIEQFDLLKTLEFNQQAV